MSYYITPFDDLSKYSGNTSNQPNIQSNNRPNVQHEWYDTRN